ncbi:glutamine amidotransferase [Petroclostridium sp. X23]|uniref:type 1 glutamine amidotransferase n=1 Tax=Petroclostridium sp. X23 TaxID=3045146 RepID=UPI0024AD50A4|nr:glutamine amidotransferase [Petroclostridium sp. X23]WHH57051.1 glutamine amidotransferase [Petroclostridium sp. X23]
MNMNNFKLTIGHLYPDLLNLYGDRGNILSLKKRCEWRGITVEIKEYELNDDIDFSQLDIIFLGGGSDREQLLVCNRLKEIKKDINEYVEDNGVVVAVCGGYQLLGHYYKLKDQSIEGLSVLDIYTEMGNTRLIGNVVIESELLGKTEKIVGFENHGGRTHINDHQPLGIVEYGHGNNGKDGYEGVIYKNVIGTYLHGPLFPKNPALTDYVLSKALSRAYPDSFTQLPVLDDAVELNARDYIVQRFSKK